MSNCFHQWVQTGRVSDEEYQCLKCNERMAYRKVDRHNPPVRKPLTDEQLWDLWQAESEDGPDYFLDFKHTARIIEKAHGITE